MKAEEYYKLSPPERLKVLYSTTGKPGMCATVKALWFCRKCKETTVHKKVRATKYGVRQRWICSECGNTLRVYTRVHIGPQMHYSRHKNV